MAAAGAPSCHIGVNPANVSAMRFYERLGWRPIEVPDVARAYLSHPTSGL